MNTTLSQPNNTPLKDTIVYLLFICGLLALASSVQAGGTATTIFDTLATETDNSVFGPLGQAIIGGAAAAGGLFAVLKGAWLMAGLGIAVAALMFGARLVAGSSGFGALI